MDDVGDNGFLLVGKFPGSLLFWGGDFIVDGICDGSCLRLRVVEFRKLYG